jgi:hypothetical protein
MIKDLKTLRNSLLSIGFSKEAKAINFMIKAAQMDDVGDEMPSDSEAELHIYDFDGTLFKSPQEPAVWNGDWWSDIASLSDPCVPEQPGPEWWISSTINSAKNSISNPDIFALMMTGRKDNSAFRYRVPELLEQAGLGFDAVHLSETGDAMAGKINTAIKYLRKYPFIKKVKIWDDRTSHLRHFKDTLESLGYEVETTSVNEGSMRPLCQEDNFSAGESKKKASYVGIFLDSASKGRLIEEFSLKHDKVKNDHVTLAFKPSPEMMSLIGQRVSMSVVGYAEDDKGQAVVISLPPEIPYLGKSMPHVTITHDKSVEAKYSNELIAEGYEPISGVEINGIIDAYPRTLTR